MKGIAPTCVFVAAVIGATAALAQGETSERRFRDFVSQGLVLSVGPECKHGQFQVEVWLRITSRDGQVAELRAIAERDGDRAAVLLLSKTGFPTSLVVGNTFHVVDGGVLRVFQGGRFHCRAGIPKSGSPGISIEHSPHSAPPSQLTLDFSGLADCVMVEGATLKWESLNQCYRVITPNDGEVVIYRRRDCSEKEYPVRAVTATGFGPQRRIRTELTIVILNAGGPPARTLFQLSAGEPELPMAAVDYQQILQSHFNDLGLTFDEKDESARALGVRLLRKFRTREELLIPAEELQQLKHRLEFINNNQTQSRVKAFLKELRETGQLYVWGPLQQAQYEGNSKRTPFRVDYDRFHAAAYTEIALGPEIVSALRRWLSKTATTRSLSMEVRCEALDLLGQFGLPPLSPIWTELEENLQNEQSDEIPAILASVRVRQGVATRPDVARLQEALQDDKLPPYVITQVTEALAVIDELRLDRDSLLKSLTVDSRSDHVASRRLRAVAACEFGRSVLLNELESPEKRLPVKQVITVLGDALTPSSAEWPRSVRLARRIALDETRGIDERVAANQIVHWDADSVASDYTEQFYQAAVKTDDLALLYAAMWNMTASGKADRCFQTIEQKIVRREAKQRATFAQLLSAIALLQWERERKLSPRLWKTLDRVFASDDDELRRYGPTIIVLLLDRGVAVPRSYVPLVVEVGLEAPDPRNLALACHALIRLSDSQYSPPVPADIDAAPDVLHWISRHPEPVRKHLRHWHSNQRNQPSGASN